MKTTYFLLTEGEENEIIGVVGATSNEELNKKALTAINEHFDSDCHEIPNIEMEDCMYGRTGEINVKVDFDNDNDNDYIATVFVKQVFIY